MKAIPTRIARVATPMPGAETITMPATSSTAVLMIGGLSFFAVVTGSITSIFITRAQENRRLSADDPVIQKLSELSEELESLRRELNSDAPPA